MGITERGDLDPGSKENTAGWSVFRFEYLFHGFRCRADKLPQHPSDSSAAPILNKVGSWNVATILASGPKLESAMGISLDGLLGEYGDRATAFAIS